MTQPNALPHPGTITFLDEDSGESHVRALGEVPPTIAFAPDAQGKLAPVIRVTTHLRGTQRVIQSFGLGGELLQRTVQAPRPPQS